MKKLICWLFFFIALSSSGVLAQDIITLYADKAPGSETWTWEERENSQNPWNTRIVYNVVKPTLLAYLPKPEVATGTAVVIAPGGGMHALSIDSEGIEVAKWLNSKGVAAFVLKYRLVRSLTDNPPQELQAKLGNATKMREDISPIVPLAMQDGFTAIQYLRSHAKELNIKPDQIGMMGFSAGGTVLMSVVYNAIAENRPNFIMPIYAWGMPVIQGKVPTEKTPMFAVVASDDELKLTSYSLDIYHQWQNAGQPAELHVYEKGGHGFGMRVKKLPSDTWIERLGDWLKQHGWLELQNKPEWLQKYTPEQIEAYQKRQEYLLRNDWGNLSKYAEANQKLKTEVKSENRVVLLGNSITEFWSNLSPEFFAGKPYINRGISGQTTSQMLVRFRADVIDLQPHTVVIEAGTNDIAQNTGAISLEAIAANLLTMAELAQAHGIRVIISSVLPAYDFPWRPGLEPADKIVRLNQMLKEYARKNNWVYLDYYSAMVDERKGLKKIFSEDGVHPNQAGYRVMAPLAEQAINQAMKMKKLGVKK
ncbi:MAG: GDSL-type esterase/lipase family protein [Microscillaceae bacterium]|jgi:lysophospholipase L1-like esterase/acetyl esterase/lipase|nr:GDSL-type esterase/lipase family protein [Microscillaceae bacterium]